MTTLHYYVESNRPNVCLFCGGPPEHPHLAPLPLSFVAPVATPCPGCRDCLALAKMLRDAAQRTAQNANEGTRNDYEWATGGDLDAFIKEREK